MFNKIQYTLEFVKILFNPLICYVKGHDKTRPGKYLIQYCRRCHIELDNPGSKT